MGTFHGLKAKDIEQSLEGDTRQYLVGSLSRPQKLRHIKDSIIDIGISDYEADAVEPLHIHSKVREYQLMLSGVTQYFVPASGETFTYRTGDFYVIDPDTAYIQKVRKGTRILFVKSSTVNDKICLEATDAVEAWLQKEWPI